MKKILMMLAAALIVGACSKNDDVPIPTHLEQQMFMNGVTKSIKGVVLDKNSKCFDFVCNADYTYAELMELDDPSLMILNSHSMILTIDSDVEIGETMSGTYDLAVGTKGENGEYVEIMVGGGMGSVYRIELDSDGYSAMYIPNMTAPKPTVTPLSILAGTLTYSLSGDEFEVELDAKFSNGKTLKMHYQGAPESEI